MEKNKKLGLIIVGIVGLLFGIALVVYGYMDLKNSSNNTEDRKPYGDNIKSTGELLYLYEEGSSTEYVGKYTCEKKYCEFNLASQFLDVYKDPEAGVGLIFDTDNETTGYFLYNFKAATKISEEYNFTNIIYSEANIDYFRIEDMSSKKVGIINSKGEIVVPVSYDDVGLDMLNVDTSSTSVFAKTTGVALVSLDGKYGLLDIKTGKEILKPEYDKIGDMSYLHTAFANTKLEEIFTLKNGKGSFVNYKTGEIVKEFETNYEYAYPINENIVVTVLNNEIDILENDVSLLEEKIKLVANETANYYLHYEPLPADAENKEYDSIFGNSSSNNFYIETDYNNEGNAFNKVYKFDISTKKLTEEVSTPSESTDNN